MIDVQILRPPASLDALQDEWESLYRRSGREPSVSFAWSRAILRNHLAGCDDWFVVVLRRTGQLVGLVPMTTSRAPLLGRSIVTLQPIDERYNTHSDLLLADDAPDVVGAWLDAIANGPLKWDVMRMTRLLEDGVLTRTLSSELARRGAKCRWRLERPSFHLPLPMTAQAYLAERSGKLRNYLRRAEKKLAARGAVTFDRVEAGASVDGAYQHLLTIERDSWKHRHGTAISVVRHQQGFYRDLVETSFASGSLHLTFLRLDGVPIAYNLGLVAGTTYYYLKTSYRQEYRTLGAASVGRARLIERLIAEGVTVLDFPGEPYEWEQQWTDAVQWHRSLLLFNSTLTGFALSMVSRAQDVLRPRQEARRIVFHDARALRGEDSAP